jgi:hypothetical protein
MPTQMILVAAVPVSGTQSGDVRDNQVCRYAMTREQAGRRPGKVGRRDGIR